MGFGMGSARRDAAWDPVLSHHLCISTPGPIGPLTGGPTARSTACLGFRSDVCRVFSSRRISGHQSCRAPGLTRSALVMMTWGIMADVIFWSPGGPHSLRGPGALGPSSSNLGLLSTASRPVDCVQIHRIPLDSLLGMGAPDVLLAKCADRSRGKGNARSESSKLKRFPGLRGRDKRVRRRICSKQGRIPLERAITCSQAPRFVHKVIRPRVPLPGSRLVARDVPPNRLHAIPC
jgi:hypothetical protein